MRNAPIVSQLAVQFIVKFMVDIEAKELEMSPAQLPLFCLRFGGKVLSLSLNQPLPASDYLNSFLFTYLPTLSPIHRETHTHTHAHTRTRSECVSKGRANLL